MDGLELIKLMPGVKSFFEIPHYPHNYLGVIGRDDVAWVFEGGITNPRPIKQDEITERRGVQITADEAAELVTPDIATLLTGLKKKPSVKRSEFGRPDQARDEKGRFEDEGRGSEEPGYKHPGDEGDEGDEGGKGYSGIEKTWMDEFNAKQAAFEKETGKKGLRYDAQLTGERTPTHEVEGYLNAMASYQRQNMKEHPMEGQKYGGTADFIMAQGHEFDVPSEPPQIKLGTPKECYSNSAHMMLGNSRKYDYVEGVYKSPHLPFPIEHAWLVDKNEGTVVDPTLGWQPKARYVGVAYPKQFVMKKMLQNKYYGIHSDGSMMNPVVLGMDKDFNYGGK